MTLTQDVRPAIDTAEYRRLAKAHLWRCYVNNANADVDPPLIFVGGEGCYLIDSDGNRYFDGTSGLVCTQIGYSFGEEIGQAALEQYRRLGFVPNWQNTTPPTIELAAKIASLAPGDLNHVFFVPGGTETVEAAWKLARQYFHIQGKKKWKAIVRDDAYHGTTLGSLALMGGLNSMRTPFEPVTPGAIRVPGAYRTGRPAGETDAEFLASLLRDLETRILAEDPDTIAMYITECVYNRGGVQGPVPGYFEGVRALCDKYDILLVIDEVVSAFGRSGDWFASSRYGIQPDIVTVAKGLSSAFAVIGATIASDRIFDAFTDANVAFAHAMTFGGHPAMTAVALKNIEIMERLDLPGHVRRMEPVFAAKLASLADDFEVVEGASVVGYLADLRLTTTRPDGTPLTDDEKVSLYGPAFSDAIFDGGLLIRGARNSGATTTIALAPPLVADSDDLDVVVGILRSALAEVNRAYLALG